VAGLTKPAQAVVEGAKPVSPSLAAAPPDSVKPDAAKPQIPPPGPLFIDEPVKPVTPRPPRPPLTDEERARDTKKEDWYEAALRRFSIAKNYQKPEDESGI